MTQPALCKQVLSGLRQILLWQIRQICFCKWAHVGLQADEDLRQDMQAQASSECCRADYIAGLGLQLGAGTCLQLATKTY